VNVRAVAIEVQRGRDGKLYPPRMPIPLAERKPARWLVHNLVHRDHLSIRAAQAVMHDQYGVRRSVGQLWKDLTLRVPVLPRARARACPGWPVSEPQRGLSASDQRALWAKLEDLEADLGMIVAWLPDGSLRFTLGGPWARLSRRSGRWRGISG